VLCLALFLVFLGGWGFVAFVAIQRGDVDKVSIVKTCLALTFRLKNNFYPTDYRGLMSNQV
jgi:hypothetical protein